MVSGIYLITAPNGSRYVGQSSNIRRRWNHHRCRLTAGKHRNPFLQNIANKYGVENLKFNIVLLCDLVNLGMYEQIAERAYSPDINIGTCGDSPSLGRKFSEEHRAKLSASLKGRVISEASIAKTRNTIFGRPKTLAQISEAERRKGTKATEAQAQALANGRTGRKCSTKQLAALSLTRGIKYVSKVRCVDTGEIFDNALSAEKAFGKYNSNILHVCRGLAQSAYGFHWEFV